MGAFKAAAELSSSILKNVQMRYCHCCHRCQHHGQAWHTARTVGCAPLACATAPAPANATTSSQVVARYRNGFATVPVRAAGALVAQPATPLAKPLAAHLHYAASAPIFLRTLNRTVPRLKLPSYSH